MKKKTINLNNKEVDIYIDEDGSIYLSKKSLAILYGKSEQTIIRYLSKFEQDGTMMELKWNYYGTINSSRKTIVYRTEILSILDNYLNQENASLLSNYLSSNNSKENDNHSDIIDDFDNKVITFDNGIISIDVNVSPKEETVWLDQNQIAELFETTKSNISMHIKNILNDNELTRATVQDFLTVQIEDGRKVSRYITFYNLDMVLAIGYRVKSKRAIEFRKWVSSIMKNYLIKGYAINEDRITKMKYELRDELRYEIEKMKEKIEEELFVQPIKEKLFVSGQCYDSYEFLSNIVKTAKEEIILVDSYLDTIGLSVLKNITNLEVKRIIFISTRASLHKESLEEFKNQYKNVEIYYRDDIHDRFILIDNSMLYVIGTSINRYMGNKVFYVHTSDDKKTISNLRDELFNKVTPNCGEYTKK